MSSTALSVLLSFLSIEKVMHVIGPLREVASIENSDKFLNRIGHVEQDRNISIEMRHISTSLYRAQKNEKRKNRETQLLCSICQKTFSSLAMTLSSSSELMTTWRISLEA
jgi:hypothetical protein